MTTSRLSDRDAIPALQVESAEIREQYADIRARMRAKVKISRQENSFIKGIRSKGRDLDLKQKKVAYDNLFTNSES